MIPKLAIGKKNDGAGRLREFFCDRIERPGMMAGIMQKPLRVVVLAGLVLGAVLGMAGTLVSSAALRAELWAIDGTALVVSTVVLALYFFRQGCDGVAAGFLVYAIGEAVMLGGTAGALEAGVPAFAAGAVLWAAGLALTSWPPVMPVWSRAAGAVAAILFGFTSLRIFAGTPLTPLSKPFPYFAYPFLVLTFAGWFWKTVKTRGLEIGQRPPGENSSDPVLVKSSIGSPKP